MMEGYSPGFIQPNASAFGEKIDKGWMVVEAGDLLEGFAASGEKGFAALLLDFLERFQAVGGECHHLLVDRLQSAAIGSAIERAEGR